MVARTVVDRPASDPAVAPASGVLIWWSRPHRARWRAPTMLSLLFPDLALIALGFVLSRKVAWGQDLWSGLERLNYFVLFPALLFHSLVRRPLQLDLARDLALAVVVVIAAGALAGLAARPILAPTPIRFASALQCAFRFNSYLALAVSQRLGGEHVADRHGHADADRAQRKALLAAETL